MIRRILLAQCTQKKSLESDLLPAIQRYTGFPYPTLLRRRAQGLDGDLLVVILSAQWGLIGENYPIPWYDRQMTEEERSLLGSKPRGDLRAVLRVFQPRELYAYLSDAYLQVFDEDWLSNLCFTQGCRLTVAMGGIGERQHDLIEWLQKDRP